MPEVYTAKVIKDLLPVQLSPGFNGTIVGNLEKDLVVKMTGNLALKDGRNWIQIEAWVQIADQDNKLTIE